MHLLKTAKACLTALLCYPLLTFSQPVMVTEIPSTSRGISSWNDNIVFYNNDSLWLSDGTNTGTQAIKGLGESGLTYATTEGRKIAIELPSFFFFISANNTGTSFKLWRSDGTGTGTVTVATYDKIAPMGVYNGEFIFGAKTGSTIGLYKVGSGSASLIKELTIQFPTYSSSGKHLSSRIKHAVIGDNYFFSTGIELWKTDGTNLNTVKIKTLGAEVHTLVNFNNSLVFMAGFRSIWKSNGTETGTIEIRSIGDEGNLGGYTVLKNKLYIFESYNEGHSSAILSSDGTEEGTKILIDKIGGYEYETSIKTVNDLFMIQSVVHSYSGTNERWRSDGTTAGTWKIGTNEAFQTAVSGSYLLFTAVENDTLKLWQSDLTTYSKTIQQLYPGSPFIKDVDNLVSADNNVFFTNTDPYFPIENRHMYLWKYNPLKPSSTTGYFTLVNTDTDKDKFLLKNNDEINAYTNDNISIRYTPETTVGSVRFRVNGSIIRTENIAPYSIAGDNNGNFSPWTATTGNYTIVVQNYSGANGGGTLLNSDTIYLTLNRNSLPSTPIVNAGTDQLRILPAGYNYYTSASATISTGSITSVKWEQISGPAAAYIANPTNVNTQFLLDEFALGTYRFRIVATSNNGIKNSDDILISTKESRITGFRIIDLRTNTSTVIDPDSYHIISGPSDSINIEVITVGETKSVKFYFNDTTRIENQAPYALFGDNSGVFNAGSIPPGEHLIFAQTYQEYNATGTIGDSRDLILQVNSSPKSGTLTSSETIQCFPNPSSDFFSISVPVNEDVFGTVNIYSISGELTETLFEGNVTQGNNLDLVWKCKNIQPGIYYMKVKLGEKQYMEKLVRY